MVYFQCSGHWLLEKLLVSSCLGGVVGSGSIYNKGKELMKLKLIQPGRVLVTNAGCYREG